MNVFKVTQRYMVTAGDRDTDYFMRKGERKRRKKDRKKEQSYFGVKGIRKRVEEERKITCAEK